MQHDAEADQYYVGILRVIPFAARLQLLRQLIFWVGACLDINAVGLAGCA